MLTGRAGLRCQTTTPKRSGLSVAAGTVLPMTIREHMALMIAGRHYRYGGAREADARRELGWSLAQYEQAVAGLLERDDVEAAEPQLVHRLRRLRDQRRAVRAV